MGKGSVRVQAEPMAARTRGSWTEKRREISESIQVSNISSRTKGVFRKRDGFHSDEVRSSFNSQSIQNQTHRRRLRLRRPCVCAAANGTHGRRLQSSVSEERERERERKFKTYKITNLNNQKKSQFKRFQHRTDR